MGFVLVATSGWHAVRQHGLLRGCHAVKAIEFPDDPGREITVTTAGGASACVLEAAYVRSGFVLLRTRCPAGRRRRSMLMTTDSFDTETFRRLRVRLRQRISTA